MDDRLNPAPLEASILARVSRLFRREVKGVQLGSALVPPQSRGASEPGDATTEQRHPRTAALEAYAEWRGACTEVRRSYRSWTRAPRGHARLPYLVYGAALDREQAAAELYARLVGTLERPAESGLE